MNDWKIYNGRGEKLQINIEEALRDPPNWRNFNNKNFVDVNLDEEDQFERLFGKGKKRTLFNEDEIDTINAALYLRRPLFITGKPGCGKSSLPYAVAYELGLGKVLKWPITTRSTLQEGLYQYDAIARLQDTKLNPDSVPNIGKYLRLGPLGTALLPTKKPRVLLIDEIDKSDIDLPNDLLNIFEDGYFDIPEIARLPKTDSTNIPADKSENIMITGSDKAVSIIFDKVYGRIQCHAFPFIVMTSNEEKAFPPAFLRRCLRFDMNQPTETKLTEMVEAHLSSQLSEEIKDICKKFIDKREEPNSMLATDQLLNAVYLFTKNADLLSPDKQKLFEVLFRNLSYDQKDN